MNHPLKPGPSMKAQSNGNGCVVGSGNDAPDEFYGSGHVLCTHDGVLITKTTGEQMIDINTSGSLSLVEYSSPRQLCIEWRPNDNILIADDSQDQGDWALVDTISRRSRTSSECRAFNTKPEASAQKPLIIRTKLDELRSVVVKQRGQTICFTRKSDASAHSEFFFQHGNADLFVQSMRQLHIIDSLASGRNEYIILTTETQRLKKTFAELDIGEIKASSVSMDSWLPNKVVGFLVNIPDYVPPPFQRTSPKARPSAPSLDSLKASIVHSSVDNSNSQSGANELESITEEDKSRAAAQHKTPLPERQSIVRGTALTATQWLEFKMADGRITDPCRVQEIIFRGGIEAGLRAEVWKYLLNYYEWDDTDAERVQRCKRKAQDYFRMKAQWLAMSAKQEANFSGYRDRKCQIEKDVKRTDRRQEFFAGDNNPNLQLLQGILMTYVMYNFDLGYVQGMSDLLAPILAVQVDEVDSFWCFVGFMDMVFANFDIDQAGMKTQFQQLHRLLEVANPRLFNYMVAHDSDNMYFCFRWLLVWYKREFDDVDILKLWECLWTRLPCANFHILVSVAILDQHTDTIVDNKFEFTEILKHINELSGNIDLERTLQLAEAIYMQLKAAVRLPDDVRKIIGEPLVQVILGDDFSVHDIQHDVEDGFHELVPELTPEEKQKQQQLLEEACERSMLFQFI